MISSMLAPDSKFSNTIDTGIRVSRNTQAPLTLPGTLSTAGHCDQSRAAMAFTSGPFGVALGDHLRTISAIRALAFCVGLASAAQCATFLNASTPQFAGVCHVSSSTHRNDAVSTRSE